MVFAAVSFVLPFLATVQAAEFLSVTKEVVEQVLFAELSTDGPYALALQAELGPMFSSLPKNEHGRLDPATVRYALHRYFVNKHGWYVKGLDPAGNGWNNDLSSHELTKEWAPSYIQELFDARLHGRGMDLMGLASFAATLSDLIHLEGLDDLESIYTALELPLHSPVPEAEFDLAIRAYLSKLIVAQGVTIENRDDAALVEADAREVDQQYDNIIMWVRDLRASRVWEERSRRNPFKQMGYEWDWATSYVKDLLHNFGSLTRGECQLLKDNLVKMEQADSGRIMLSSFYNNHELELHESVDYLRNLGALEEDGTSPRLVIPNYISSPSRCLPFSGYFSVCCPDECEGLLGSIEKSFATSTVTADRVVEVVSKLASATVDAPRNLSAPLLAKVGEIASHHGGYVPLHGRLFMQWLHHAYPRECPYPHVSGTVKPVTQDEWLNIHEDIDNAMVSDEERAVYSQMHTVSEVAVDTLPWSAVEELVAPRASRKEQATSVLRPVMLVLVVCSFALSLFRSTAVVPSSEPKDKQQWV